MRQDDGQSSVRGPREALESRARGNALLELSQGSRERSAMQQAGLEHADSRDAVRAAARVASIAHDNGEAEAAFWAEDGDGEGVLSQWRAVRAAQNAGSRAWPAERCAWVLEQLLEPGARDDGPSADVRTFVQTVCYLERVRLLEPGIASAPGSRLWCVARQAPLLHAELAHVWAELEAARRRVAELEASAAAASTAAAAAMAEPAPATIAVTAAATEEATPAAAAPSPPLVALAEAPPEGPAHPPQPFAARHGTTRGADGVGSASLPGVATWPAPEAFAQDAGLARQLFADHDCQRVPYTLEALPMPWS